MRIFKHRRVKKLMSIIVSVSFLLQAGHLYIYANEGSTTDINTSDSTAYEIYDSNENIPNDEYSDVNVETDEKNEMLEDDQVTNDSEDMEEDVVNEDVTNKDSFNEEASNTEENPEELGQDPIDKVVMNLAPDDVVNIPDATFKALLNTALKQNINEDITVSQLESITGMLQLTHSNISDLTGIEYCKNITGINMWSNNISNIEPIAGLENLIYIDLYNNKITDISALKNLTNLKELFIENNQISDISSLKNLTNLVELRLENNQITNISSLEQLVNLKELRLDNNKISFITELENLVNLEILRLDGNQIYDITPLSGLNNLKDLRLNNQSITGPELNIASVANMVKDKDGRFVSPAVSTDYEYREIENIIKFLNVTDDGDISYTFSTNVNIGSSNAIFSGTVTHSIKNINMISVTVPISAGFQLATNIIDENGNLGFEFLSSEYRIVNNSNKPIKISVSNFVEYEGNTLDLVNPDEKEWENLNQEDSMKFMAVGIYNHSGFKDINLSKSDPIWLTENTPMSLLGSIEENGKEGLFTFTSKHGKNPNNATRASEGKFDLKLQIEIIK